MIARNTTETVLQQAARDVGVELRNLKPQGRGFRFTLGLGAKRPDWRGEANIAPFTRQNHTLSRKVAAVCWHGYRDFMLAVYDDSPEAIFITAMARYEGLQGFKDKFLQTGAKNIGSTFSPMRYADACFCGEGVSA